MPKFNEYAEKTIPDDSDIFLLQDISATKKITLFNIFNKMKSKLGLSAIATSGHLADATGDVNNRTIKDAERTKWDGYETSINELNRNMTAPLHSDNVLTDVMGDIYQSTPFDMRNYERKKITPASTNRPPNLQYGYRDIYIYDANNVIIEVTEMIPVYGRKHYNFYNGSGMSGWTSK